LNSAKDEATRPAAAAAAAAAVPPLPPVEQTVCMCTSWTPTTTWRLSNWNIYSIAAASSSATTTTGQKRKPRTMMVVTAAAPRSPGNAAGPILPLSRLWLFLLRRRPIPSNNARSQGICRSSSGAPCLSTLTTYACVSPRFRRISLQHCCKRQQIDDLLSIRMICQNARTAVHLSMAPTWDNLTVLKRLVVFHNVAN